MMFPPYVIDVRVREAGKRGFRIWIPMFLLWPLLLVLALLALVVTIVLDVALLAFGRPYHHYTLFLLGCFETLFETRGLFVDAVDGDDTVHVSIR